MRHSGTSSAVRHLQPPTINLCFRHPDAAQGRDSLTVIMDPSGSVRVEDPHYAGSGSAMALGGNKPLPYYLLVVLTRHTCVAVESIST